MSLAGQTPRQNLDERPPKDVVVIGDSERKTVPIKGREGNPKILSFYPRWGFILPKHCLLGSWYSLFTEPVLNL